MTRASGTLTILTMSHPNRLSVLCVPAFTDNYLWVIHRGRHAVVVDPGDAVVIEQTLVEHGLELDAILVTHHHPDHVGGIDALCQRKPVPVIGPAAEMHKIPSITQGVADGDVVSILGTPAQVLEVPGHTLGHIAFHLAGEQWLFCGDTLFSAGCGRLFEGSPEQMLTSLRRLSSLPDSTRVYCAHEYTMSNLAFAAAVEPASTALSTFIEQVAQLRQAGTPSIPSRIGVEKQVNPFLRIQEPSVRSAIEGHTGDQPTGDIAYFAALRAWKDGFRPAKAT